MRECFVSAPPNVGLRALKDLLKKRKVRLVTLADTNPTGLSAFDAVERALSAADYFIAVVGNGVSNANVFVELGLALAKHKRAAIIHSADVELPVSLSTLPIFGGGLQRTDALAAFLEQFLEASKGTQSHAAQTSRSRPLLTRATHLLNRLEAAKGHELEEVIAEALRASGVGTVVEAGGHDRGYDVAIWVDELEHVLGNPVLIEVKRSMSVSTARRIKQTFVTNRSITVGKALIVVYVDGPEPEALRQSSGWPLVIFVRARRLLLELRHKSLGDFLRAERNRLAHGV